MANRQHRGVKLLTLRDGRNVARFTDPITRKQVQQSMDAIGLSNAHRRKLWAIEKAQNLLALRAQIAQGGTMQVRVTVENAKNDYLAGFANANSKNAKIPPLRGL